MKLYFTDEARFSAYESIRNLRSKIAESKELDYTSSMELMEHLNDLERVIIDELSGDGLYKFRMTYCNGC